MIPDFLNIQNCHSQEVAEAPQTKMKHAEF